MYCKNCGKKLENDATYCYNCGAKFEDHSNNLKIKVSGEPPINYNSPSNPPQPANIPEEYKPISMWGYFGYEILFMIPCVGIILLLVFSFGGTKNVNLKNFARSYFCVFIICVVLFIIATVLGVSLSSLN